MQNYKLFNKFTNIHTKDYIKLFTSNFTAI